MNKLLSCILFLFITCQIKAQEHRFENILDSIQQLRKLVVDDNLDLDTRLEYAKRASELSYSTEIDSTILLSNEKIAYIHALRRNFEISINLTHKNLRLARKLNDSLHIGKAYSLLGYNYSFLSKQKDSSYYFLYKSINIYEKIKREEFLIECLVNLANIQYENKDYVGSESTSFKTINLIKSLPKDDLILDVLIRSYCVIGLNSKGLKLYNKAIEYHKKAIDANKKLSNKFRYKSNYLDNQINIAEVYKETGEYKKAISIYNDLLKDKSHKDGGALTYTAIMNNLAYNLFLDKSRDTTYIKSLFKEAYTISDSLKAYYEITGIGNDWAEFCYAMGNKDSALILSKNSYKTGKNIKRYDEVSRALLMLSKLEEGEKGKQYLYEHINLNDSLIDNERAIRNKFARIRYETDTYIDETKRLTTQNILIIIIGLILALVFALLFFIKSQLTKNKILRFEREQQKSNEEIYELMLKQQSEIKEGRLQERLRISEDLHDGILNKLMGSRLGLEFISMSKGKDHIKPYIEEIQKVEKEVRDISHELNHSKLTSEKDFTTILEEYLSNLSGLHLFKHKINCPDSINWDNIGDHIKINLYRIIQEAVQNVIKHAKAETITLNFYLNDRILHLGIMDDGIGFNVKQQNNGIGLKNISSRVSKINGVLKIYSAIDKGTTLSLKLPV